MAKFPRKYKVKTLKSKLGRFIKVRPIISERSGEAVRNQYELEFEKGYAFQSYDSLIGIFIRKECKYYFTEKHDCSTTTSKYCGQWCGMNGKERRAALQNGKAGLIDTSRMD